MGIRSVLVTAGVAVATVAASVLPLSVSHADAADPSSWVQAEADGARSNQSYGESTVTAASLASAHAAYALQVHTPGCWNETKAPAALFASDGSTLYFFDGRRIVARNLASGDIVWRGPSLRADSFSPVPVRMAVMPGYVFLLMAGCDSYSDPGADLVAFSTSSGARQWSEGLDTYADDLAVGPDGNLVVTSEDINGGVSAVDISLFEGYHSVAWTASIGSDHVVILGDTVLLRTYPLGLSKPSVVAVRLADGGVEWTTAQGWSVDRADPPQVSDPMAYLSDPNGRIVAVDATGHRVWRADQQHSVVLAVAPDRVIAACGPRATLCALDRATGRLLWNAPVKASGATVAADVVYASGPGTPRRLSDGSAVTRVGADLRGATRSGSIAVTGGLVLHVQQRQIRAFAVG